jgi:hypothetical protein
VKLRHFALAPLFLVLVACRGTIGGAGSAPTLPRTTQAPITKAAYLVRANAICTVIAHSQGALGAVPQDPIVLANMVDRMAAITDEGVVRLRTLPMPPHDAARLQSYYAKVTYVSSESRRFAMALRAGDRDEAITLGHAVERDTVAADLIGKAYGLTVCAGASP